MQELLYCFNDRILDQQNLCSNHPPYHKSIFLQRQKHRIFKQNSTLKLYRAIKNHSEESQKQIYQLISKMMAYYHFYKKQDANNVIDWKQQIINLFKKFFTQDQIKIKIILRSNNNNQIADLIQMLLQFSRKIFQQKITINYKQHIQRKIRTEQLTPLLSHSVHKYLPIKVTPELSNIIEINNISQTIRIKKCMRFIDNFHQKQLENKTNNLYLQLLAKNSHNETIIWKNYEKCYGNKQLIVYNFSNLYTYEEREDNIHKLKQEIKLATQNLQIPTQNDTELLTSHFNAKVQIQLKKIKLNQQENQFTNPINSLLSLCFIKIKNHQKPFKLYLIHNQQKFNCQEFKKHFKMPMKNYLKNKLLKVQQSKKKFEKNNKIYYKYIIKELSLDLRGQYFINKMLESSSNQKQVIETSKQTQEQQNNKELILPTIPSALKFSSKLSLNSQDFFPQRRTFKLKDSFTQQQIQGKLMSHRN